MQIPGAELHEIRSREGRRYINARWLHRMHIHAPDPLEEVEPKRGRGSNAIYIYAILLCPSPPADFSRWGRRLISARLVHIRPTAPPVGNECTNRRSGSATIYSN